MIKNTNKNYNLKKAEKNSSFLIARSIHLIRNDLDAGNLHGAHKKMMTFLEVSLKFLSAIIFSDFQNNIKNDSHDIESLLKKIERPSLGNWIDYIRTLIGLIKDSETPIHFSALILELEMNLHSEKEVIELKNRLVDFIKLKNPKYKAKPQNVFGLIEELVTYRNKYHGHGDINDHEYEIHLQVLTGIFTFILSHLSLLTTTRLAYLQQVVYKDHKYHLEFFIWEAANLYPEVSRNVQEKGLESEKVYLCDFDKETDKYKPLFSLDPILILRHDPKMGTKNVYCLSDISLKHVSYIAYPSHDLYEPQNPDKIYNKVLNFENQEEYSSLPPDEENVVKQVTDKYENSQSMEIVDPRENPQIWEGFEGVYYAYNAPFKLENKNLNLDEMVGKHDERYKNEEFKKAVYLFFTGDLNNKEDHKIFTERLDYFKIFMTGLLQKIPDILPGKLEVYFCNSGFPNITFFSGSKAEMDYGIIYYHNPIFMDGDSPRKAFLTRDEEILIELRQKFESDIKNKFTLKYNIRDIVNNNDFIDDILNEFKTPFKIRKNITSLNFSPTLEINEIVGIKRKSNEEVYHFGFGQAPFPVPQIIKEELFKNSGRNEYLPTAGLRELRDLSLKYFAANFGFDPDLYNCIIGPGSKELIYDIQLAVDGDLILPIPSWVSYGPQSLLIGDDIIYVDTDIKDNYHISPEKLESCVSTAKDEGKKPKKLILNYPNNPTGLSLKSEQLKGIAAVCRKKSILIISDEIYGLVKFDKNHQSIAKYYPEGTIITTGLSKHISLGGYRIGFAFIPKSMTSVFNAMCRIGSETWSAVSSPIQYTSIKAFEGIDKIDAHIQQCTNIHKLVTSYVWRSLMKIGINDYPEPEGAFYLYPDFEKYRTLLMDRGIETSVQLASDLLIKQNLASLPGSAFGDDPKRLRLRLATCDFDGETVLNYYKKNPEVDPIEFVEVCCPRIKLGCEKLELYFKELDSN